MANISKLYEALSGLYEIGSKLNTKINEVSGQLGNAFEVDPQDAVIQLSGGLLSGILIDNAKLDDILAQIDQLKASSVTSSSLSPVDQSLFESIVDSLTLKLE